MRIKTLPEAATRVPFSERQQLMQSVVNETLHRRSICPVGEYVAGPRAPRVGVYHDKNGWYVSSNFDEPQLERLGFEAICNMRTYNE